MEGDKDAAAPAKTPMIYICGECHRSEEAGESGVGGLRVVPLKGLRIRIGNGSGTDESSVH